METWPTDFPMPNVALVGDNDANSLRTEMDSGAVRQRRRFTAERLVVRAEWTLSDTEFGVFCAYHKFRLNLGNDWVIMNLPLAGGIVAHVVRFVNGKFTQNYEPVNYWRVRADLEVQERVTFSEGVLDVYLDVGFSEQGLTNLIEAINNLHECIHQTLPVNLN